MKAYTHTTTDQFIELRGQGLSLEHIAATIRISKRTAVNWNRKFKPELRALRALHLEARYERFIASRTIQLERLGALQDKIDVEMLSPLVSWERVIKLLRASALLRRQIEDFRLGFVSLERPLTPDGPPGSPLGLHPSGSPADPPLPPLDPNAPPSILDIPPAKPPPLKSHPTPPDLPAALQNLKDHSSTVAEAFRPRPTLPPMPPELIASLQKLKATLAAMHGSLSNTPPQTPNPAGPPSPPASQPEEPAPSPASPPTASPPLPPAPEPAPVPPPAHLPPMFENFKNALPAATGTILLVLAFLLPNLHAPWERSAGFIPQESAAIASTGTGPARRGTKGPSPLHQVCTVSRNAVSISYSQSATYENNPPLMVQMARHHLPSRGSSGGARARLEVQTLAARFRVSVADRAGFGPELLFNSRIRVVGFSRTTFTSDGRKRSNEIVTLNERNVHLLAVLPRCWEAHPLSRVSDAAAPGAGASEAVVHLAGKVRTVRPGGLILLDDGTGQVELVLAEATQLSAGDPIEVLGAWRRAGTNPSLGLAVWRKPEKPLAEPGQSRGIYSDFVKRVDCVLKLG